jgi:hypothetical protein
MSRFERSSAFMARSNRLSVASAGNRAGRRRLLQATSTAIGVARKPVEKAAEMA